LVGLLRRYFLNRTDQLAAMMPWRKPGPILFGTEAELDAALASHVEGRPTKARFVSNRGRGAMVLERVRLGTYAPAPDRTTRWLCLDFDGAGHASALADPLSTALSTRQIFRNHGLPAYLERSGSGSGYHLWCFFDPPVLATEVRKVGLELAPKDAPLMASDVATPHSGRGIEVFPKQDQVSKLGVGNMVWVPWCGLARPGCNLFYEGTSAEDLSAVFPFAFETVTGETLQQILAALAPSAPSPTSAAASQAVPLRATKSPTENSSPWKTWRAQAVATLPVEKIYGAWLTGRGAGEGWLECRDPASPSGDRHPSAGVATGTGEAPRGTFHSFITGKSLSVFDFLIQHGGLSDFRAAIARVAELSGVTTPKEALPSAAELDEFIGGFFEIGKASPARNESKRARLPVIIANRRQLRDIAADAWKALLLVNDPPRMFIRSGMVSRLVDRDFGPQLEPMSEDAIVSTLGRVATWQKVTENGLVDCMPSRDAARDLAAYPDPTAPRLRDVVFSPVFDRDCTLISTPGYHPGAELWLHLPSGFSLQPVPERPTAEDVRWAKAFLLEEVLVDFPFVSEADCAHALAAMLCPLVRRMIEGHTPAHLYSAPKPGSGKGLCADLVAVANTGRQCEPTTFTRNEEEVRKKITSLLSKAPTIILIDNVRDRLDSAQFAAALTSNVWSDRILGETRMGDFPNRATWLITANNPSLSTELARRCIPIQIDAKLERPWTRTSFKHPKLSQWMLRHRGQVLYALLVLVRSWVAAGKKSGSQSLGSFEAWAEVVGGILEHAGIDGFLANLNDHLDLIDEQDLEWPAFVEAWGRAFGEAWCRTDQLLALARSESLLPSLFEEGSDRSAQTQLGMALRARRGHCYGLWQIEVRFDRHANASMHRLVRLPEVEQAHTQSTEAQP
jgi:hypothetical protein